MKRATIFVLLLIYAFSVKSQSLVVNPGFETWSKIEKPTGWSTTQNCLKDSVSVNEGNYSCKQTGGTGTAKYLGQSIAVEAGKSYVLSFYYRTETTGSGNGCRIWCYWKDSDGNTISDAASDDILRPSKYLKSDNWVRNTIETTAPNNATSFYLEVRTYANSITWWDDFIFEKNVTTNIYDGGEKEEVMIYPNPAHDFLYVNSSVEIQNIEIVDLNGRKIKMLKQDSNDIKTILLNNITPGEYWIYIKTKQKFLLRRFIKN